MKIDIYYIHASNCVCVCACVCVCVHARVCIQFFLLFISLWWPILCSAFIV